MSIQNITIELQQDRSITIETGKLALLAGGSVTVRQGDTIVLVAACSDKARPGIDFLPLQVDYREKFSAAGQMPGGYFKREGRPSEKEILTSRMTDRPLRPLFPKGFFNDVQIQALLLSADGQNEPDVLCMLGASAALMVSDIPFGGPVAALRVGLLDGQFVANPTQDEITRSQLDLVYAGIPGKTIMIEGAADEVSEEVLRDALIFADEIVVKQVEAQDELASKAGKPKETPELNLIPESISSSVRASCDQRLREQCLIPDKSKRTKALDELRDEVVEQLKDDYESDSDELLCQIKQAFAAEAQTTVRRILLDEGKRIDGRGDDELRPISCEVGILPRTHGSGLFSRGETQALVVTTLGSSSDSQELDSIAGGATEKTYILHYNFPNFSVGETGRIMGPGRREIGHGALAERSIARMMPKDYPYTVRCVSEIMGSNGSTSMASICGATLSLMDAGVPLQKPVAGISCGLVAEDDKTVLLTDILGSEDHYGDMDFKVAGTVDGITGFQLDLKIPGIPFDLMYQALQRNKKARLEILEEMSRCIAQPRSEVSPLAPRIRRIKINPEKIGFLIGPGGKTIRGISEAHNVQIDIDDDGTVNLFTNNEDDMKNSVAAVQALVAEVELGKIYHGVVKSVKDFGAFVEILPGQEGLLHISELADYRVKKVDDICSTGDKVTVKVVEKDDRGRIRLSRKAALSELEN